MKIFAITYLLILMLVQSGSSYHRKTDRGHDQLSGKVKTVRIEKAKLSNKNGKWVEGNPVRERMWAYDNHGSLIAEINDGRYHHYAHDSAGNRVEKYYPTMTVNRLADPTMLSAQPRISDWVSLRVWVPKYDPQGNRIEEAIYEDGRLLLRKFIYTYDSAGRRTEALHQDAAGKQLRKWTYQYEADGRLKERIEYVGQDSAPSIKYSDFQFDLEGNWIKATLSKAHQRKEALHFEASETVYRMIAYY
jgi:hypothetical protein